MNTRDFDWKPLALLLFVTDQFARSFLYFAHCVFGSALDLILVHL